MTTANVPTFQYPRSSIDTKPYWEGARRGELLFQRCKGCAQVVFHPRAVCPYCLSGELAWEQSAGRGKIYSFTLQYVPLHRESQAPLPQVLGIVELDEGFHMFTAIDETDFSRLKIDARVEVYFDAVAEDLSLPKFRLVAAEGSAP